MAHELSITEEPVCDQELRLLGLDIAGVRELTAEWTAAKRSKSAAEKKAWTSLGYAERNPRVQFKGAENDSVPQTWEYLEQN